MGPPGGRDDTPHPIEPAKVFDNLYILGEESVIQFAIKTSEGVILIDSGYADSPKDVIIPQLTK